MSEYFKPFRGIEGIVASYSTYLKVKAGPKGFTETVMTDGTIFDLQGTSLHLNGFYMGVDAITVHLDDAREMFALKTPYEDVAHSILQSVKQPKDSLSGQDPIVVGVHIRRGTWKIRHLDKYGGDYFPSHYWSTWFQKVLQFLDKDAQDVIFLIASDDYDWCKENIDGSNVQLKFTEDFYESHVPDKMRLDHVDFAVMTCSNHILYDYGTFSFWAGILTEGHTFLPRHYYNMEHIEVPLVVAIVKSNMVGGRFHFVDEL